MTDTFKDQPFDKRFKTMGDPAETACAEWLTSIGRGFEPYGLNRPKLRMDMLPARIRHTPDFITSAGLIECKGFGRDQIAKVKFEDINCLSWWNDCFEVSIYFWDSYLERGICIPFSTLRDKILADVRVTKDVFPDANPKPYWAIPAAVIWGE